MHKIKFGIPKGSLFEITSKMLCETNFFSLNNGSSLKSLNENIMPIFMRAQEIGTFVDKGFLDFGITGLDWIKETKANVELLLPLIYSRETNQKLKWVVAVKDDGPIHSIFDLNRRVVYSELLNVTRDFFKAKGIDPVVKYSWGATETKILLGACDGIVDCMETGRTLKGNHLKEILTIFESQPFIVVNKKVLKCADKMDVILSLCEKIKMTNFYDRK